MTIVEYPTGKYVYMAGVMDGEIPSKPWEAPNMDELPSKPTAENDAENRDDEWV